MTSAPQTNADPQEGFRKKPRSISLIAAGTSQFAGQALGILIAVLVSHLIARRMGAGQEADAFLLGRRLVTSVTEALSQIVVVVFIPLVAARAAAGESVLRILWHSGGAALALGVALAGAFALGAPAIVASLAPGFDSEAAALATKVVVILSLSMPATVATIAFSAYCNVRGSFGLPAMVRQVPRAAVAVALVLGGGVLATQAATAYAIAFFVVAVLTLALALRLGGDAPGDAVPGHASAAVGRRGAAAILLTFGSLASIWLESAFAARQGVGALAMLDFGQRLGALCGNTLAMALGLVAFADLSRRAAAGETADLGRRFRHGTLVGLALLLPVQLGFVLNAGAVVDVVIAHGEAGEEVAAGVTEVLRWMALAPFGALVTRMMLVRLLAQNDLPILSLVALSMALDFCSRLVMFAVLTPVLGLLGVPVALAVAPAVPILFLAMALKRKGVFAGAGALAAARPMIAASVLGCLGLGVGVAVAPMLARALHIAVGDMDKLDSLVQLSASGGIGIVALAVGVRLFGVKLKLW